MNNKRKLIVILLIFGVPVHTELIESNTKARPDTKWRIRYIVIHETDNFGKMDK